MENLRWNVIYHNIFDITACFYYQMTQFPLRTSSLSIIDPFFIKKKEKNYKVMHLLKYEMKKLLLIPCYFHARPERFIYGMENEVAKLSCYGKGSNS